MENRDPSYHAKYKEVADYASSRGLVIGSYSLLASRGAGTADDNCGGPGCRIRYGTMPCLGSSWGRDYLVQLQSFLSATGFGLLEHDGSYPGDTCARTTHPGHQGLGDSQWVQFKAIAEFYQWCRANGIYLNVPDWYYLNGSSKCAMNYKETNWSLPRNEQEIIERQNVYDGTWEKTASMGWMFVPLTQLSRRRGGCDDRTAVRAPGPLRGPVGGPVWCRGAGLLPRPADLRHRRHQVAGEKMDRLLQAAPRGAGRRHHPSAPPGRPRLGRHPARQSRGPGKRAWPSSTIRCRKPSNAISVCRCTIPASPQRRASPWKTQPRPRCNSTAARRRR